VAQILPSNGSIQEAMAGKDNPQSLCKC